LSYENCEESSTHVKVTTLTPKFAKVGRKTRITGSGMLDSEMSGGTFQAKTSFTGGALVSCSGDAGKSTTCGMHPFGALTFDGMQFPVKKGSSSVSMDLSLSHIIPASLANTETKVTARASNGDKLFCMKVFSTPAGSMNNANTAPAEESSHAASAENTSQDGMCLPWGAKCDPKAILPWDKCCTPKEPYPQMVHTCCDLGPGPGPKEGGFVCAFKDECPRHSASDIVV